MITQQQIQDWVDQATAAGYIRAPSRFGAGDGAGGAIDPIQMISQGIGPTDPGLANLQATQEGTLSGNPTVGAQDFYKAGFNDLGNQYMDKWRSAEKDNGGLLNQAFNIGVPAAMAFFGGGALGGFDLFSGLPSGLGGGLDTAITSAAPKAAGSSGMWDWLDSFDTGAFDQGVGLNDVWNYQSPTTAMPGAVPEVDPTFGGQLNQVGPGSFAQPPVPSSSMSFIDQLRNAASLKSLFGGSMPNINIGRTGSTGGGVLDSVLSDPLGAAFNSAPFLLALNEANKQSGDINNVLGQINGQGYTDSVLHPYDFQTGQGRAALESDLALRGVAGSSFGNNDLNNFQYMRDLGRGDLASKAGLASASLQGQLINQRNTNKNLLLGAGLNASASLFKPQRDPFGLAQLMGA